MSSRLHLAASRIERLAPAVSEILCQPGWVHLGEPPINWESEIREQFNFGHWYAGCKLALASVYRRYRPRYSPEALKRLYSACEFREFHFDHGGRLDFDDGTFSFVMSEHFFEHLNLPLALEMLRECHRIMKSKGAIRICVPDADFRTYAAPEPVGYPSPKVPWTHHQKHLMRWNVESLSEALRLAGFTPRPVIFCTRDGQFRQELPPSEATDTLEPELLSHTKYLRRLPSLVVDGIKHD